MAPAEARPDALGLERGLGERGLGRDFIAKDADGKTLIAYVYSNSRSGETPLRVLTNTVGKWTATPPTTR